MGFRNLTEMVEFMESCKTENGNMTQIDKLLDKVNKLGVESLTKYELDFWNGQRNIEEFQYISTTAGIFFLQKLKELGIIESCGDANINHWSIWIFEMNGGFDYYKNHQGLVEICIEEKPLSSEEYISGEVSNTHSSNYVITNFEDSQDFESRYELFISFSDDWEECVETLEIREKVATFLDEKLRNSGLQYKIDTTHES